MKSKARWIGAGAAVILWLTGAGHDIAQAQTIGGRVYTTSAWVENLVAPPGDGDHLGNLVVGLWTGQPSDPGGFPDLASVVLASGALPFSYGPYFFSLPGPYANGKYQLIAWIDGNRDGAYDPGEPHVVANLEITDGKSQPANKLTVVDDSDDGGSLPDWWEWHWFHNMPDPFSQTASQDTDSDGLLNSDEARICTAGYGMDYINPAHWDTDGDKMDDKWEYDYYSSALNTGMHPVRANGTEDYDGDGLNNWQEYCGVDGYSRLQLKGYITGVYVAQATRGDTGDDLNPLDIDTDFDLLVDSFEAAWYDVPGGIDPHSGAMSTIPNGTNVNMSIAKADPDQDGLSNYREQCLLASFREGAANGDKWVWTGSVPFPYLDYYTDSGERRRIVPMKVPLSLGLAPASTIPAYTNRCALRGHEWTDPTEGTSYYYTDEYLPPGHDSDNDSLPDGWEVQFGLDPRDNGVGTGWTNGPYGDPDGDKIQNLDEYLGQDGSRFTTKPYINGTGDETNPNTVDHRPDSCYEWRWHPADVVLGSLTDPRVGLGINRNETLGSSLPTLSLGKDLGWDTDDDGISDKAEIHPSPGVQASSPVHSCDPFHAWAVLVTNAAGIPIPDPEPAVATNGILAGVREDLLRRDWTLECQVKLLGTNLVGDLFNYQTRNGPNDRTIWRLSLVRNAPVLSADTSDGVTCSVSCNALPTNRWVHLAGVWDHAANSLAIYLDGVMFNNVSVFAEMASKGMLPATNALALAASTNGSFVNNLLLDEVRIWGVARSARQIAQYAHDLVPPCDGDDVWIDAASPQYYGESDTVIVNGGSLFYGEPGLLLASVRNSGGNFWIDDGDGQYNASRDTLLASDTTLVEGLLGALVGNVRWNDKDGDGVFSRNSLLAYFRFDDGGLTAEDFARPAKNSLIGAAREDLTYGDRGYALATGFQWVTNDAAPVYGVDARGADDSDHDGLPDGWELVNHLDPWDNGAHGESTPGAKDGTSGAAGDPDHDGLSNQYEFWADTNPRAADSDKNGVPDAQEDHDGDGVDNVTEQTLRSRPDMADTDDDGLTDGEELTLGTSPANPSDPPVSRAVALGGSPDDYLSVASTLSDRLDEWTLEAWVNPTNATAAGAGTIVRRVVENLSGGTQAVNYAMGLETNGAGGGLRLYAGFLMANGTSFNVRGGSIPGGVWTHVAATYDRLTTSLTLYTNGVRAATTNTTLQVIPPVNGRGGDSFLRIGEDFGGFLDEVRLWSRARTGAQIAASRTNVISGAETNGLVHDFRFDDGTATTNLIPFGPFHEPGGFQDFTTDEDWNEQWRHAAQPHGAVATGLAGSGAITLPPSLRVLLQPPEAVATGAGWMIESGLWRNSGDNVQGLAPGDHTVAYKPTLGWSEPASETVTLTNGLATTITRQYLQDASIRIGLQPDAAVAGGAAWQVDSGVLLASGSLVTNLAPGVHTIHFVPVAGYVTPDAITPTLAPGELFDRNVKYDVVRGALTAVINPADAVTDGALWRYTGGLWTNSGAVVSNLPLGSYTVEFAPVGRWITPGTIPVVLASSQTLGVTGVYSQVTGISADIAPAAAISAGAQWRVGSGDWTNAGAVVGVAAGTYTVSFKPLDGWLSPGDMAVVVVTQHVARALGTYYTIAMVGNGNGANPGQFSSPRGLALDARHRLYVADTLNSRIQVYDPIDQSWTTNGTYGHDAPGAFDMPSGLAVDGRGNIYVADQNNSRVQVWIAASNTWKILGSGAGSAVGQFFAPSHVAVGADFALYVADYGNSRVQKMDTNGQWSVVISSGTGPGQVYYPLGILVDGRNALYVSDDGVTSNELNRIQQFDTTGAYKSELGSSVGGDGALWQPAGMALGVNGLYVADSSSSRILVRSFTNGVWTTLLGPGVVSNATDVAYDSRGILYVADTGNNRILALPVLPANVTNGAARAGAASLPGANGFVVSWYGVTGWLYAVQYASNLVPGTDWRFLPGASNIVGQNAATNRADRTVGVTNRFYRIMAY